MRKLFWAVLLLTISAAGQDVRRPTTETSATFANGCTGTLVTSSAIPNAYDAAGQTTSSQLYEYPGYVNGIYRKSRQLSGWTGTTYTSLSLNVVTSCTINPWDTSGKCAVAYSLDNGSSWTQLRSSTSGWAQVTDTVALSPSQNLTQLQVGVCAQAQGTNSTSLEPAEATITVYDVRTEGTLAISPEAPTELGVAVSSMTQADLTWTDTSQNETGFKIERCVEECTGFTQIATAGANATSYSDTGTSSGTQYQYRVRAYNATGDSAYSNTAVATTPYLTIDTPFVTKYTYDALGNLLCAEQHGSAQQGTGCDADSSYDATSPWRIRRFEYDSLGRLRKAKNPESATIEYTYDANGNVVTKSTPAPNAGATGNVITTFSYDDFDRVVAKSYTKDGQQYQAAVSYEYDNGANALGQRTKMVDASGQTIWTYYPAGQVDVEARTIASVQRTVDYDYFEDGSVSQITYPTGLQVAHLYDTAGRPKRVSAGGVTFAEVVDGVCAAPLDHGYSAAGAIQCLRHNGDAITVENSYNERLQPLTLSAKVGLNTIASWTYDFGVADNNGNVHQIANNLDGNRSQAFEYDAMNRLRRAYSAGPEWGERFTIDSWGNLTNVDPLYGKTYHQPLAAPADLKNQLTTLTHDSAGNVVNDGGHLYTYDGENRILTGGGEAYVYDGDGERVQKVNGGKLYWTGTGADALVETDAAGVPLAQYVYFAGKRVARQVRQGDGSWLTYFYFGDHLGTSRKMTDASGAVCYDADFYPYGAEQHVYLDTCPQPYKFTGKERDGETGLDYFGIRYFAASMGRFMSPDSIANDWELVNPQTWNRYAYARSNPLIFVDPEGAAVELLGDEEQRKKELAVLQKAVGNKEAAERLYINKVKDGDKTRYFVGIKGDVGDFMKLGETSHDLANIVQDKQVVEFGLTNKDLTQFGGAVTYDKGEAGNQNVRVLVNPDQMGVAYRNLSPSTVYGYGRWSGQNQNPPWRVRPFTPEIATWHEFGHGWGNIHGRAGHRSDKEANAWENRMREQVYGPFGPNNAKRVAH